MDSWVVRALRTGRKGEIEHMFGSEGIRFYQSRTLFLERDDLALYQAVPAEAKFNRIQTVASSPRYVVAGLFPGPAPEQLGMIPNPNEFFLYSR